MTASPRQQFEATTSEATGAVTPEAIMGPQVRHARQRLGATWLAIFAAATGSIAFVQWYVGAWTPALNMGGDAAGHFVNSLMIRDYLLQDFGRNPMSFALTYYEHVPRVSIGHWPPFFPLVQALLVSSWDRSIRAALLFQAVIAGALGATAGVVVASRHGRVAALAATVAVLMSPAVLYLVDIILVDNFLALLMLLSALSWARFADSERAGTGSAKWSVLFALAASAAILTKGNGYALGLLPVFYIVLTWNFRLLASWRTWMSACIVGVLTGPWYALTYKMQAAGFVYQWGLAFTGLAAQTYPAMALHIVGALVIASFLLGTAVILKRNMSGETDPMGTSLLSLVFAVICFQLIAPADIQARYLVPAVPPVIILAIDGLVALSDRALRQRPRRRRIMITAMVCAVLAVDIAIIFEPLHVATLPMDAVAQDIMSTAGTDVQNANPLVLVAGDDWAEGTLIATFAARDTSHFFYVIRASSALATTNFMGSQYEARFGNAAKVDHWIFENRIGWLVVDSAPKALKMQHDQQVAEVIALHRADWPIIARYPHANGVTTLYRLDKGPVSPEEIARVVRQIIPKQVVGE